MLRKHFFNSYSIITITPYQYKDDINLDCKYIKKNKIILNELNFLTYFKKLR